jgi:ParB family chromosome partitioning protein
MGIARALIGHGDALALAEIAVAEGLSVRDVETLARKGAAPRGEAAAPGAAAATGENADIRAVQQHLEEFLGLAVKIRPEADPRKGTVTIRYTTLDQLDLVCQRLTGGEI